MTKPTYKAEKERTRRLVDSIPWGAEVIDPELIRVLKHHKDWETKTANGRYRIKKKMASTRGAYCLQIFDDNQRYVDEISLDVAIRCMLNLTITKDNPHAMVQKAFRNEIQDQVKEYRNQDRKRAHSAKTDVDHDQVDFVQLTRDFLQKEGMTEDDVKVVKLPKVHELLEDKELALRWKQYHRLHAVLTIRPIQEHLDITRKRNMGSVM